MSKDLWVSADGSWGLSSFKKFDTTNWRDNDWDRLDSEPDSEKLAFAKYITRKRDKQAKKLAKSIIRDYEAMASMPIRTFIIGEDGSIAEDFGVVDAVMKNCCDYCDNILKEI